MAATANKSVEDLTAYVQTALDLPSKAAAKRTVEAVITGLTGTLEDNAKNPGFEYRIFGLGTFKVQATKAKKGRNPATGAAINIPARTKIAFKLTKTLADLGK